MTEEEIGAITGLIVTMMIMIDTERPSLEKMKWLLTMNGITTKIKKAYKAKMPASKSTESLEELINRLIKGISRYCYPMSVTALPQPTLPQALRTLGALMCKELPRPVRQVCQRFYKRDEGDDEKPIVTACALGKVGLALLPEQEAYSFSTSSTSEFISFIYRQVGLDSIALIRHPCSPGSWFVSHVIMDLNDKWGWTIPGIADWLKHEADRLEQEAATTTIAPNA